MRDERRAAPDARAPRTTTIDLVERDAVQLLAVAAHELRTPLTAIIGFAESLATSRHEMSPEAVDAAIDALERQAHRLATILDELLVLGSYDHLALRREHSHLDDIVSDALDAAPPPPHVNLVRASTADGSLDVRSQRTALARVVVNLLTNAYRYGGANVIVECRSRSVDDVEIIVEDDGDGVPSALVSTVFSPFAHGAMPARGGPAPLGLGLSVAREITEAAGGELRYEPAEPHGARFVVALPRTNVDIR